MILYHGSNVEVKEPKLINSDKGKDFGIAFYLTPIKEQAERMAKRKRLLEGSGKATISVFEWDEKLDNLFYKSFPEPTDDWLDMIVTCRANPKHCHGYDIVEGKIADDSVGVTVLFYLDKVITKEQALERLKYQKINNQIAFCTEKSFCGLKFLESYEVK